MKKYFSALLIILLSSFTTAPRIVWLDELDLSNVDQSAGKAIANQCGKHHFLSPEKNLTGA